MKKRIFGVLICILTLYVFPLLKVDAHTTVMTAGEFISYLQYVVDRGDSKYGSGDQYSIGKYDGSNIYFDCWGLGESIICSKGRIVYNKDASLNPWNLFDTSCGCGSRTGDWLKSQCQLSTDFSNIVPGEWLFRDNSQGSCYHVGFYIGNGKVIESTTDGAYKTQISTIDSSGHSGNIGRGSAWTWTSHAKVPWIDYGTSTQPISINTEIVDTKIVSIDSTGYTIYCTIAEGTETVLNSLQFPTWTDNPGLDPGAAQNQDDLANPWPYGSAGGSISEGNDLGVKGPGMLYAYTIKINEHNNEKDTNYRTDIYAVTGSGNKKIYGTIVVKYGDIVFKEGDYWNDPVKISDIQANDADIFMSIANPGQKSGTVGFYLGTSQSNLSGYDVDTIGSLGMSRHVHISEYAGALTPGTKYYCQLYVKTAEGKEYRSELKTFTTKNGEMTAGYDRTIPDGDYLIVTAGNPDKTTFYYLDINGTEVPASNQTNVALCGPVDYDVPEYEIWTVTYSNGFYSIKQKGTNASLDLWGASTEVGANVCMCQSNGTSAQQWAISQSDGTGYRIQAKCSGLSLDIQDGNIATGTNVRQWSNNDTVAQKWLFIPYKPSQPIDDGKYILLSGLGDQWELDVPGDTGDIGDGTNVTIWNDNAPSRYNSFRLVKLSNGYYKIVHDASGKCLDVANGSVVSSGNVGLCQDNGSIAQQWVVRKNGNGYSLIAKCSGYALDVWGNAADGTNVAQGYFHGGANQTWKFVRAEYSVKYDANGGSGAPAEQTKYYKADLTLQETEPVRDDYIFLGWADDADAAGPDYQPGGIYELEKDVTMYAVWESACDHQVSYTVVKEPTLTDTGKLSGVCSVCGKTVEITLPVLNDTDYRYAVKTPSTCQKNGTASYIWTETNGQTFVFEGQVDKIGHDYVAAQNPPTCIDDGSTTYTCSMCGDTYTERIPVTEPSGDEGWTTEKPADVPEDMIFSKTQYRYRDLMMTTSTASSMAGWTQTGSSVSYGDYGAWSGWSENAQSGSDTRQVETRKEYRYYYFYCPVCGGHEPLQGISDCHQYTLTLSDGVTGWFTTPYSDCNPQSYSYTTYKKWTTSLGDGQRWNLSTADIGHTEVGYQGDAGTPIIRLAYRYRDRSKTTVYSYEKWGDWSSWGDTEYTATSGRQVETRTVYKYDAERDNRHVWGKPEYTWDDETSTLTAEYHCTLDASHEKTETIENVSVLRIPAGTKVIEEEAFAGTASQVVVIQEGCETIGRRAFADCPELLYVVLPDSIVNIEEDAFEGSAKFNN